LHEESLRENHQKSCPKSMQKCHGKGVKRREALSIDEEGEKKTPYTDQRLAETGKKKGMCHSEVGADRKKGREADEEKEKGATSATTKERKAGQGTMCPGKRKKREAHFPPRPDSPRWEGGKGKL